MQNQKNDITSRKELFLRYIDVCNKAIEAHQGEFPYAQLWHSAEESLDGLPIVVAVYDDEPKAAYRLSVNEQHIDTIDIEPDAIDNDDAWHVRTSYMQKVIENPEEFIENPAKIDWGWMQSGSTD